MVFSSLIFTGMFLPIVYLVNLFLPLKLSNIFLLAASVFLYAWGEPVYVLILLGCIAVNYVLARLIARGIGIGASQEDVIAAYGDGFYSEGEGMMTYNTSGDANDYASPCVIFTLENGAVSCIDIYYPTNTL